MPNYVLVKPLKNHYASQSFRR